eukprot:2409172-Prymnesium_polylepis.3
MLPHGAVDLAGGKRLSQHPRVADAIELGNVARSPEPGDGSTARVVKRVAPQHDVSSVRAVELKRATKWIGRLKDEVVRKEVVAAISTNNARPLGVANLHVHHGSRRVEADPGPTTNPNARHRDLIGANLWSQARRCHGSVDAIGGFTVKLGNGTSQ